MLTRIYTPRGEVSACELPSLPVDDQRALWLASMGWLEWRGAWRLAHLPWVVCEQARAAAKVVER